MTDYDQHAFSAAFPPMTEDAFAELRTDIAANGLVVPIVLFAGEILDGWHRQRACRAVGVPGKYVTFQGDAAKARAFAISANLKRRHLDASQRAMIAETFWKLESGQNASRVNLPGSAAPSSVDDVAAEFNVSAKSVKDARVVKRQADPDTIARVERGEVAVSRAAKDVRASTPRPVTPTPPPSSTARQAAPTLVLHSPAPKHVVTLPNVVIEPRTVRQWEALTEHEKRGHLTHMNPKAALNRQSDGEDGNLIDWAKWTWNPITGCLHSCPYCYARDIATRFSNTSAFPNGFEPTLRADRLTAPLNFKPRHGDDPRERRVFTGSMTDLFGRWVPAEWISAVLDICRQAPLWDFLMLTKFPKRMAEFDIPSNVWMGTTVDCQARVGAAEAAFERVGAKVRWLSCEPMIEPLKFQHLERFELVVIGGASPSSKTPAWIPPFEWIGDLMRQADAAGCNVFLKSNLYRKEQPGGPRYQFADRAPEVFHYLARAGAPDQQVNAA